MKRLFLTTILSLCSLFSIYAQTIEITAANRLVEPVFERSVKPENIVELKSSLKNTKGKSTMGFNLKWSRSCLTHILVFKEG